MKYITKPENFLNFLRAQDPFVAFLGILQTGMRFPYPFIIIISLACIISCETHNLQRVFHCILYTNSEQCASCSLRRQLVESGTKNIVA